MHLLFYPTFLTAHYLIISSYNISYSFNGRELQSNLIFLQT